MASDQFGNYIANIEPVPAPYPPSGRCCRSGVGPPLDVDGNNGQTYIDLSTGDLYAKSGDVWNLVGSAGGSGNLSGFGSPIGAVTPTALNQWYRNKTDDTYYWATGLTSADWQQVG